MYEKNATFHRILLITADFTERWHPLRGLHHRHKITKYTDYRYQPC